jgi:translation initiation factor IF-2
MKSFDIIYNLTEFVKNLVLSNIPKEYIDEISGTAKILMVFSKNKDKQILGGKVEKGSILIGSEVKILRREGEIGLGRIKELQQQKVKASEVNEGYEFGALIESKIEIAKGDRIQCFKVVEKKII